MEMIMWGWKVYTVSPQRAVQGRLILVIAAHEKHVVMVMRGMGGRVGVAGVTEVYLAPLADLY
jgi:hypothetical protein